MELVVDGISFLREKIRLSSYRQISFTLSYQYRNQKCRYSSIVFHPDFISSKNQDIIQAEQLSPFFENSFVSSYVHVWHRFNM